MIGTGSVSLAGRTDVAGAEIAGGPQPSGGRPVDNGVGLTAIEAGKRLAAGGPNAMPEVRNSALARAAGKFWAPVPWMLEATIVLQIWLGMYFEAAIVAALLSFNAALGLFHEGRAQATLDALKQRLAFDASVRRDGRWQIVPSAGLVSGDVVKLSLGGVVAADVRLASGEVLIDQSMLTGESVPLEAGPGAQTYAGALVRRGEAIATVTATGQRTKFGRTAELVRDSHVVGSQETAVLHVVRNLAVFNGAVIATLALYSHLVGMPTGEIVPLILTAVLASIPVALPATFTLASALGAQALAKRGVLPTRLSAMDEAATFDVLCVDKTGTLTCNALTVARTWCMPGHDVFELLNLAALASSDGGQDPVDAAIRLASAGHRDPDLRSVSFLPFDPMTKMAVAAVTRGDGPAQRVVKGAFDTVRALASPAPAAREAAAKFEAEGFRVLGVAAGQPGAIVMVGLIALSDPPRADASGFVRALAMLGVRTVMVTGDAAATASHVARAVGIDGPCSPVGVRTDRPEAFGVFAGVLPEDKWNLIRAFQGSGHSVGMCGDGANDAPALRQANIGIAVSTATDVAKSAAGMVLTEAGLEGIVAAVREGRVIFQRVLTYTLNSIVKKVATILFLACGLVLTGHAVLTPLLMIVVMITGDFLAMSLTTDNVEPSPTPNSWRIAHLSAAGVILGGCLLAFCLAVLAVGRFRLGLGVGQLQTLSFLAIVFGGQGTIYAVRVRRRIWSSRPSGWLVCSSVVDLSLASVLAVTGLASASLSLPVILCVLGGAAVFAFFLDAVKGVTFAHLSMA